VLTRGEHRQVAAGELRDSTRRIYRGVEAKAPRSLEPDLAAARDSRSTRRRITSSGIILPPEVQFSDPLAGENQGAAEFMVGALQVCHAGMIGGDARRG
jgi:hypothetical protein